jgi:TonB family protein
VNRTGRAEELDLQVEMLMAGQKIPAQAELGRGTLQQPDAFLLARVSDLQLLPDPDFKARLKSDLLDEVAFPPNSDSRIEQMTGAFVAAEILPTLGGKPFGLFPADHRSFLVSFASHAALVLLIASGVWVGARPIIKKPLVTSEITFAVKGHGGGGSGDYSPVPATRGTAPKFSDQQVSLPVIVVHNPDPKLAIQSTVVGPPDIKLPQSNQLGDLVSSNVVLPSNGTGSGGAAGDGTGTGLGSGAGLGYGPGFGRGAGVVVFTPGGGVTAPKAIYDPEPEYSDEARRAKHEGIVLLALIVDQQGRARNVRIVRSLGMGLDEKAIEAIKKWKFAPGTKDGYPVAVQVNVEVNFRLY